MITTKGTAALAAGLALPALASMFHAWVLAVVAVPIVLVVSLAAALDQRPTSELAVTYEIPETEITPGDSLAMRVLLENPGPGQGRCELRLHLPAGAKAAWGSEARVIELETGGRFGLPYEIEGLELGQQTLGPVQIRRRGLFGLFATPISTDPTAQVRVVPGTEGLTEMPMLRAKRRVRVGTVRTGQPRSGHQFYALREYQPGDPVDAVNWKQTARSRRPIVNEFEQEVPGRLVLLLDSRATSNVGRGAASTFQAGLRAVTALSLIAWDDQYRVWHGLVGEQTVWHRPERGRRGNRARLEEVLATEPRGGPSIDRLLDAEALAEVPSGTQVVLVTPDLTDPGLVPATERLVARASTVSIISPNPILTHSSAEPGGIAFHGRAWKLARRVCELERETAREDLLDTGVAPVVDWRTPEKLAIALAEVEAWRS